MPPTRLKGNKSGGKNAFLFHWQMCPVCVCICVCFHRESKHWRDSQGKGGGSGVQAMEPPELGLIPGPSHTGGVTWALTITYIKEAAQGWGSKKWELSLPLKQPSQRKTAGRRRRQGRPRIWLGIWVCHKPMAWPSGNLVTEGFSNCSAPSVGI